MYLTPSVLTAVYRPSSDEHSLLLRWLGPAVPLQDPVLDGAAYLSIYLSNLELGSVSLHLAPAPMIFFRPD